MKVEILVKRKSSPNPQGFQAGDIITIQPAGHKWGKGDLEVGEVVLMDLACPCPEGEWKKDFRCSQCRHNGIKWATEDVKVGDIADVNDACPLVQYENPETQFKMVLDSKGFPTVEKYNWVHKRRYKVDLISKKHRG